MVSEEKNLPDSFDVGKFKGNTEEIDMATTKNVKWVAKLGSQTYGNPTVSGGTLIYKVAATSGLVAGTFRCSIVEVNGTSVGVADWIASLGSTLNGSVIGAGLANRVVWFDGWITVGTSGTLNIQAQLTSGAASVLAVGTYLEVFPVT